jgi:hypothetical protein
LFVVAELGANYKVFQGKARHCTNAEKLPEVK